MTEEIRRGIRIDSLSSDLRDCMPPVIGSIEARCSDSESCILPRTIVDRDRILTSSGVPLARYQACLSPESVKLGAGLKSCLSFGGILGGVGVSQFGLGLIRERTKHLPSRLLVWGSLPLLLLTSFVLVRDLLVSERAKKIAIDSGLAGMSLGGLGVGLMTRSRLNKATLPYWLAVGSAVLLMSELFFSGTPVFDRSSKNEKIISSSRKVLFGMGIGFGALSSYRFLKAPKLIPAWPLLIGSLGLALAASPAFTYYLSRAEGEEPHRELKVALSGILTGIALAGLGVGLAIRPRIRADNLVDDLIIGGVLSGCFATLFLLGAGQGVEAMRRDWKATLNPAQRE